MDRILSFIIKSIVFLAHFTKRLAGLGIGTYDDYRPGKKFKILLAGYNGARNTGSDVRVAEIARQLKTLYDKDSIEITVMVLEQDNLRGYFEDDVILRKFSSIFVWDLYRACSEAHAAILCEGSALKSTFANALTLFLCEAAGVMAAQGKPCIAYGVEVGHMEPFLKKTVVQLCRQTWFITRAAESQIMLDSLGLKGVAGTDTAWTYDRAADPAAVKTLLQETGWDGEKKLLGAAVINPFCWPVRASMKKWIAGMLTGNREGQYDKWYYFSDSAERRAAYKEYTDSVANALRQFAEENDCFSVLLGMERLDDAACRNLAEKLGSACAVFLSGDCSADLMTGVLRELDFLVTSRYHAAVLSMKSAVPIVAVSMDERLDSLMRELSFEETFLHHVQDPALAEEILTSLGAAKDRREEIRKHIDSQYSLYLKKQDRMGRILKRFFDKTVHSVQTR